MQKARDTPAVSVTVSRERARRRLLVGSSSVRAQPAGAVRAGG